MTAPEHGASSTSTSLYRAVALVVVAAAVAVLLLYHLGSGKTPTSTSTTTTSTTTLHKVRVSVPPIKAPAEVTVQVLNGVSPTGSLAGNLTTKIRAMGYHTLTAQNTTAVTKTSEILVAKRGFLREAKVLARKLKLATTVVHAFPVPATAPVPTAAKSQASVIVIIGTSLEAEASTS